ncbi:MAG TPA: hypothetical protein VF627_15575 [Abditibacterium sp.]|jgi:hypothetical protein
MSSFSDNKETLLLSVTEDDEYWAQRTGLKNPLLLALLRSTGTLWSLFPDGLVLEAIAPYRACRFPRAASFKTLDSGSDIRGTWRLELVPTRKQEGYSLQQSRVPLHPLAEAAREEAPALQAA